MHYSTLTDAIGGVSLGLAGGAASALFVSQILRLPVVRSKRLATVAVRFGSVRTAIVIALVVGVLVGIMLCWLYMSAA